MHLYQRTIAKPVTCSGVGVHSGKKVNLTVKPAPINHGIKFFRTDLPNTPYVSAIFNMVVDTSLATVIGSDGVIVSTIEHLMACFAGLSISNAIVELDAYEMPIMDGSAAEYTKLINTAGIQDQNALRHFFVIKQPIEIHDGDRYVGAYPSTSFKITCTIVYDNPLINEQTYTIDMSSSKSFTDEISKCRTFGFFHEYEYLKKHGLARGASLETGIAIDNDRVMNEDGLRYSDEFVRHKVLDAIGDFSLLGMPILGHIKAYKSGHAFNHAFLKKFFEEKTSWETKTLENFENPDILSSKSLAI